MTFVSRITVAALTLSVIGCGDKVCLLLPRPVVEVDIREAGTNTPAGYRASLIVQGPGVYDSTFVGPRADSAAVRYVQSHPLTSAGSYTVRVRRAGYQVWQQAGVSIDVDECGGSNTHPFLTVLLQPLP